MAKQSRLLDVVDPPAGQAVVYVCEKCGKRADSGKNPSYELASKIKRAAKHELEKGDVRTVLTSCMKLCPDDRIAISIVSTVPGAGPVFIEAAYDDIDATSEAVVESIRRTAAKREAVLS